MDRFFKLKERGTTIKTELIAGMTVFFSMVYILMVNASMFANPAGDGTNPLGVSYGAIYIATAISAVVGTVGAGLLSNLPLAQASGMGLNAFFVHTVCIGFGLSYENALVRQPGADHCHHLPGLLHGGYVRHAGHPLCSMRTRQSAGRKGRTSEHE